MIANIFLNELSHPVSDLERKNAKIIVKNFVGLLKSIKGLNSKIILHCNSTLFGADLGNGFSIGRLKNDPDCKDEITYLKTLVARSPFSTSMVELKAPDPSGFEYLYFRNETEISAQGLGLAHLFGGLAISFDHMAEWDRTDIELLYRAIDEAGNLSQTSCTARHASRPQHLDTYQEWFDELRVLDVRDGRELWERRVDLFPNVTLLDRCKNFIQGLGSGSDLFRQVYLRLSDIDQAVEKWDPSKETMPNFAWTPHPESESRINSGLVTFMDPSGNKRVFSLHMYVPPEPHRLHFLLETAPRKLALVGHVGRKLGIG